MDYKLELLCVLVSDVDDQPWGRFGYFSNPAGNSWNVQEIVRPAG